MSKSGTESCKADPEESFPEALAAIRRGEVVVYPTETLYGLGADALCPKVVEEVFAIKGRDPANPIPVLVADLKMLSGVVSEIPIPAKRLMERFWPGPLTLVLPAVPGLPPRLVNAEGGIGVRISRHPVAGELIRALGRPLTATSANPSGRAPARTIDEAKAYFSGRVRVFMDGGALTASKGSTVVDATAGRLRIIREGDLPAAVLERCLDTTLP
ncbi:MAG TPA: L-threonylcarbamoyladenylate synthase [candidate division Zixibacteria bacterium]|nr:L-threonylcarbamoyladenylate synthase [candidate division Zixibacteria bacterium]